MRPSFAHARHTLRYVFLRRSTQTAISAIGAIVALAYPLAAHAEDQIASLLWLIPLALVAELYFNLIGIYPWLFGGMAIAFLWHAATGRDLIPFLFDTHTQDGLFGGRTWGFNLHRTLAWLTGFATIFIVFFTMLANPKFLSRSEYSLPGEPAKVVANTSIAPVAPPQPPAPPAHPLGQKKWPTKAGYLTTNMDHEDGLARFRVYNEARPVPVYVKLCRVVQNECVLQRQLYLPPYSSLLVDNLVDGNYELYFIENHPPQFSTGKSAPIRINGGRAHEFDWAIPAAGTINETPLLRGFTDATRERFDAVKYGF
jgi:preprotein translocase subunit SecG